MYKRQVQAQRVGQRWHHVGNDAGALQETGVGVARVQAAVDPQPHRRFLRAGGEDRLVLSRPVVADALRQPGGPRGFAAGLRQALALCAAQYGIDHPGLVRATKCARRVHAGRHRRMRGQSHLDVYKRQGPPLPSAASSIGTTHTPQAARKASGPSQNLGLRACRRTPGQPRSDANAAGNSISNAITPTPLLIVPRPAAAQPSAHIRQSGPRNACRSRP